MNKTIKNTLFATSVIAAGFAGVTAAVAATADGTTGPTSTGTLDISLKIDNKLKVSNLDAIDMGTFSGSDMTGADTLCVYFNQGGAYQVTVDSNDVPGTFELDNAGTTIPYTLEWDDGVAGLQALTAGTALTGLDIGGNDSSTGADDDCVTVGADNATIQADAAAADILAAGTNATYTEEVSILVEPDL